MDSENTPLGLPLLLAILFHLLLVCVLMLGVKLFPETTVTKPLLAMQASIVEEPAKKLEEEVLEPPKKLSRAEKRALARAKREALRLEQAAKRLERAVTQQFLAAAAQKLVMDSLREQKIALIASEIKKFWQPPAKTEKLHCVIFAAWQTNGQIKSLLVQKSSGYLAFDNAAKAAVYKAGAISMPTDEDLRQKIINGFPLSFGHE